MTCHLCGRAIPNGQETQDHLIPRLFGGSLHPTNLAPAHQKCNQSRGHKPLPDSHPLIGEALTHHNARTGANLTTEALCLMAAEFDARQQAISRAAAGAARDAFDAAIARGLTRQEAGQEAATASRSIKANLQETT